MRIADFSLSKRSKYFSTGYGFKARKAILTNSYIWGTQTRVIRAFLPKWKKVRRRKGLIDLVLSCTMVPYTAAKREQWSRSDWWPAKRNQIFVVCDRLYVSCNTYFGSVPSSSSSSGLQMERVFHSVTQLSTPPGRKNKYVQLLSCWEAKMKRWSDVHTDVLLTNN